MQIHVSPAWLRTWDIISTPYAFPMKSSTDTMGQFSSEKIIPKGNPLDTLCATLEKKMQFEEGERGE